MLQQQLLTNQSVLNLAAPILKFCDFKCTLKVIVTIYVCYICLSASFMNMHLGKWCMLKLCRIKVSCHSIKFEVLDYRMVKVNLFVQTLLSNQRYFHSISEGWHYYKESS